MKNKIEKPFERLAVRYAPNNAITSSFSVDDEIGYWIDPCDDAITWNEFTVYGIPFPPNVDDADEETDDDLSQAIEIGKISGCHIAKSLIVNLGGDPYEACDDAHAELEAMYSVIQEYEDDFIDWCDDIYYIHEVELNPEYQGFGYEEALLYQLPAIIVESLHVFPSLLMYFPRPTQYDEPERDEDMDAIIRHHFEYRYQNIVKGEDDDNVILFPPKHKIPEEEINRLLGRRNPGTTVPEAYRDQDIYNLYKSVGFKEIGRTGWLCKRIASIFTEDGLNH